MSPRRLFDNYLYFSSYSDSYLRHARSMADTLYHQFRLRESDLVLEIASNDGYLLQFFQALGTKVLGVEPAANIAAVSEQKGIPTLRRFFNYSAAESIAADHGPVSLVIGNNVLAHVPSINDFMRGVELCLAANGRAVFEVPDLGELLRKREFDTIYHEHVFYYSLMAISGLAARNGLEVFDVERQKVHGGSLRVFLGRPNAHPVSPAVQTLLRSEHASGLHLRRTYQGFGESVAELRHGLVALIRSLRREGSRIAGYGAPAKGNTLLNYCGLTAEDIEFTVDRSPHKQGLLLPGSRIPVYAPSELRQRHPEYALIFPWNLSEEIVSQQEDYLREGGTFIVPVPEPYFLSWNAASGIVVRRRATSAVEKLAAVRHGAM